jgi:molybdopterin-binding protein
MPLNSQNVSKLQGVCLEARDETISRQDRKLFSDEDFRPQPDRRHHPRDPPSLRSTILEIHKGATTSHVVIDVNGAKLFASITNEAVEELGLSAGQKATAVIKTCDVMIAVE